MTDRDGSTGDSARLAPYRRVLLRAVAGAAGLSFAGGARASDGGGAGDVATGDIGPSDRADATTDPHTSATVRAVVAAGVPATPGLAARRGDEHEPGGLAVGLDDLLVWGLNNFLRVNPTTANATELEGRLPEAVAALLDAAAAELLARGENESAPDTSRFPAGGTFAALAPRDRFRALHLIETHELPADDLPAQFREFNGDLSHVVAGIQALVVAGYYTEWSGYERRTASPDEWEWTGDPLSYRQTDYPGPADGYAALRGYELQHFRENDWRDAPANDDGAESGDATASDVDGGER